MALIVEVLCVGIIWNIHGDVMKKFHCTQLQRNVGYIPSSKFLALQVDHIISSHARFRFKYQLIKPASLQVVPFDLW